MLIVLHLLCSFTKTIDACMPTSTVAMPPIKLCPAVPQRQPIPPLSSQFKYSALTGPSFANGETIYKCMNGLVNLYSAPGENLNDNSILVCKPNTGKYWRRYTNGQEALVQPGQEFICREQLCPAVPQRQPIPPLSSQFKYSALTGPSFANGETIYKCMQGLVNLYSAPGENLNDNSILVCKPNTGKYWRRYTNGQEALVQPGQEFICREPTLAELTTDPCSDLVPGVRKLEKTASICPTDRTYIIRGLDEFGNLVTLDNDNPKWITYDNVMMKWEYADTLHGRSPVYLTAASCAIAQYINDFRWTLPKPGGNYLDKATTSNTYNIQCCAGLWIMDINGGSWGGWVVAEATCWK